MNIEEKVSRLGSLLEGYGKAAVAFSGGVDSSFLAKVCFDVLGEDAIALTVDTAFVPRSEISDAAKIAEIIGIRHKILQLTRIDELILQNNEDRCYLCKKAVFGRIWEIAGQEGMTCLLDGSNLDDLDDFRPGMRALEELKVKSPMIVAQFTKADIREASQTRGLPTWNKPALACLASRVPYGREITPENLAMIEKAEDYLLRKGIKQLRVRFHGDVARIEVAPEERSKFFETEFMDDISVHFKKFGFRYAALDTEGYRTGKLNKPNSGSQ